MTTKSEFNADEWERVARAPALAGVMVALADRGGTFRESLALGKAYAAAKRDRRQRAARAARGRRRPRWIGSPRGSPIRFPSRSVRPSGLVEEKATPEEAEEYRQFVLRLADVVAHAHKEGGVLGIGGKEVSPEEQAALDRLSSTLSA